MFFFVIIVGFNGCTVLNKKLPRKQAFVKRGAHGSTDTWRSTQMERESNQGQ